jgi:hypothetical protein
VFRRIDGDTYGGLSVRTFCVFWLDLADEDNDVSSSVDVSGMIGSRNEEGAGGERSQGAIT